MTAASVPPGEGEQLKRGLLGKQRKGIGSEVEYACKAMAATFFQEGLAQAFIFKSEWQCRSVKNLYRGHPNSLDKEELRPQVSALLKVIF